MQLTRQPRLETFQQAALVYQSQSAKERLDESFPKTYEYFEKMCEENRGKGEICMDEVVYDHMMDWCHAMKRRIEHMESDEYEKKK